MSSEQKTYPRRLRRIRFWAVLVITELLYIAVGAGVGALIGVNPYIMASLFAGIVALGFTYYVGTGRSF